MEIDERLSLIKQTKSRPLPCPLSGCLCLERASRRSGPIITTPDDRRQEATRQGPVLARAAKTRYTRCRRWPRSLYRPFLRRLPLFSVPEAPGCLAIHPKQIPLANQLLGTAPLICSGV